MSYQNLFKMAYIRVEKNIYITPNTFKTQCVNEFKYLLLFILN